MSDLTSQERDILQKAFTTGDFDAFTEHFFRLPMSGTWYTIEDRVDSYLVLHDSWTRSGKPDSEFVAYADDVPITFRVAWDPYYGNEPMFLLPHGYRSLPWMKKLLAPEITTGLAITGAGTGKSQSVNANILTPNGWCKMGDMRVGDHVIGQDGLSKKVFGVYPQGIKPVYRVTFSDGSSTLADTEHLWYVEDGHLRQSSWKVVQTNQLMSMRRAFIPFVEPVQYNDPGLAMDPYMMGALLGDGGFTGETLKLSSADDDILQRVKEALCDNLSIKHENAYDYCISRDMLSGCGVRNPAITALRYYGLWGRASHDKFIPDEYKHASLDDRVSLLQGLMDTDGSLSRPAGTEFTTTSEQLALDMRELVQSLGGKCSIKKRSTRYTYSNERRTGRPSYRVYIRFYNAEFNPFHLQRKKVKFRSKATRLTRRVVSVESEGLDFTQCIDVEDDLYVTDDYIVTHNTCGVAIAGLTYCALFPGFRFLNVAPTTAQAQLILGEVEKWCSNTEFKKFIRPTRGVNDLWVNRGGHPTITIDVVDGYHSTFVCQTVGRDGRGILGGERDWINVDETQLLLGLDELKPILATRLRGTRSTGIPRWSKQTYITNPGRNPELVGLVEELKESVENGATDVLVLEDVNSSENVYLTRRQLDKQRDSLVSGRSIDRWIGGQMSAAFADGELAEELFEQCRSREMDNYVEEFGQYSDVVGLTRYEEEWDPHKSYVVVGDTGKSSLITLSSQNVPCVMVFEIPPDFLEKPCRMVAFYWFDGSGSYKTFIDIFKHAMYRYRAQGYYDASNVQTAMEDFEDALGKLPTTPIFFSGSVAPKRWAISVLVMMMSDGLFEWPYIKGLWHQARIFDPSSKKQAEDIIATLLVLMLAFRVEAVLLDKLVERYGWNPEEDEDDEKDKDQLDGTYLEEDRYSRLLG